MTSPARVTSGVPSNVAWQGWDRRNSFFSQLSRGIVHDNIHPHDNSTHVTGTQRTPKLACRTRPPPATTRPGATLRQSSDFNTLGNAAGGDTPSRCTRSPGAAPSVFVLLVGQDRKRDWKWGGRRVVGECWIRERGGGVHACAHASQQWQKCRRQRCMQPGKFACAAASPPVSLHISEPPRLRRIPYAFFCLKKKNM